jgi:hypothetical protein
MTPTPDEQPPQRPSKGQRRINTILQRIPAAREQLLVAMESFPPDFSLAALIAVAESTDARERNKVAVVEREYELLLNWCNELAARLLAEGQRLGVVEKTSGYPSWSHEALPPDHVVPLIYIYAQRALLATSRGGKLRALASCPLG